MSFVNTSVAAGCLILALSLEAAAPGVRVQAAGGTDPAITAKSTFRLDLTGTESLLLHFERRDIGIAYRKINTVEYGQNVSRRYAAAVLISPVLLLSKSRQHFVTIGYLDETDKQQALVFRVEKGDIRTVLTSLEARTGRRVEYQDGEARKSGKG
jgi:hypothetical protein